MISEALKKASIILAASVEGNPIISVIVVGLFYIAFNFFLASIERLIFGERFEHYLDPAFSLIFIGFAGYSVYGCALYNTAKRRGGPSER